MFENGAGREMAMKDGARPEGAGEPALVDGLNAPSRDLQELWFATRRWEWSTLVLVPAHPGGSAIEVAKALARVSGLRGGKALKITAEGMSLASTSDLVEDIAARSTIRSMKAGNDRGKQTIIAIDSVVSNPAGIAVAVAADAVLLCVELGRTAIESAQRTVELIGRERFIGCVVIKPTRHAFEIGSGK
jgi:hypothetical protein